MLPVPAAPLAVDLDRLARATEVLPRDASAPAPPPGRVPRGDARSLRRHGSPSRFALVYRDGSALVTRRGVVGREGEWRIVEYPSIPAASRAYASACADLLAEGYVDYIGES